MFLPFFKFKFTVTLYWSYSFVYLFRNGLFTDVKKSTEVAKNSNTSSLQIQKSRYGTGDSEEVS
jgi:hypothetical protein